MDAIDLPKTLLQYIRDYGSVTVMFVLLLIYFVIPWTKMWMKKEKQMIENSRLGNTDQPYLEKVIEVEGKIVELLGRLASEIECQWAVIWLFHNGTLLTAGYPFLKMSVVYQYTTQEKKERGQKYQNIPISFFSSLITEIKENGNASVDLNNSTHSAVVSAYKDDGVFCGRFSKITNVDDVMIGILSVSWEASPPDWNDLKLIRLNAYAHRIAMYLSHLSLITNKPKRRMEDLVV
jgi:hypothetical protein